MPDLACQKSSRLQSVFGYFQEGDIQEVEFKALFFLPASVLVLKGISAMTWWHPEESVLWICLQPEPLWWKTPEFAVRLELTENTYHFSSMKLEISPLLPPNQHWHLHWVKLISKTNIQTSSYNLHIWSRRAEMKASSLKSLPSTNVFALCANCLAIQLSTLIPVSSISPLTHLLLLCSLFTPLSAPPHWHLLTSSLLSSSSTEGKIKLRVQQL